MQVTPIKNILYVNDSEGREAHHRMYQRTTFYSKPIGTTSKPQVVACNKFYKLPWISLKGIL